MRGGREVFAGLSFAVGSGDMLAVTGPNGSGKSSLLRLLAGLLRPQAGSIHFHGCGEDEAVAHYLGHADALKPALTLRETLRFSAALYGGDAADANLDNAARMFGLGHALDLPVGVFSAGQRRRAGLARLILSPRPLWLLDEPAAALDSDGEALLGETLSDHLARGGLRHRGDASRAAAASAALPRNVERVNAFLAISGQTLRLALRAGGGAAVALVFFLAVVAVFPFGVGPDLALLSRIGPAILWIAALLASLLGLDRLFSADAEDGTLDHVIVSGVPLFAYVLGRVSGHWIAATLPVVIAAPILGLLLNLEPLAMGAVALTLLVGTPALTLIGAVGSALTAGLPRGGLPDRGARAAAHRAGAHLRRRGDARRDHRSGAVPRAVPAALRRQPCRARARANRGRGGAPSSRSIDDIFGRD